MAYGGKTMLIETPQRCYDEGTAAFEQSYPHLTHTKSAAWGRVKYDEPYVDALFEGFVRGRFFGEQNVRDGGKCARAALLFGPNKPPNEVERLAQFLHDEGGFGDAMTDRTWPEHDGDTGQRGEGWVKIVPSDVAAHFRDVARRWLLSSTVPQASADEILFLRKALTAIQGTPDKVSDLCTNVRMRNIAGFALLGQEW